MRAPVDPKSLPHISPKVIQTANSTVLSLETTGSSKVSKRKPYKIYTSEERYEIGKFASENGDSKAKAKYNIAESTARYFCDMYTSELSKRGINSDVSALPTRKRGAPTLLPEKLDKTLREYLLALRQNAGVVTSVIIKAVAIALIESWAEIEFLFW